jgi:hypothetical protein
MFNVILYYRKLTHDLLFGIILYINNISYVVIIFISLQHFERNIKGRGSICRG